MVILFPLLSHFCFYTDCRNNKKINRHYIDPDQAEGLEAYDGKKFKEIICYTLQPLTHMEIMENSRKIDENDGYTWKNLKQADVLFHYLWYCELNMADSEEEAESRLIGDEHTQDNKPSFGGKYDAIGDFNVKEYVEE